jgi:hypothetical protein
MNTTILILILALCVGIAGIVKWKYTGLRVDTEHSHFIENVQTDIISFVRNGFAIAKQDSKFNLNEDFLIKFEMASRNMGMLFSAGLDHAGPTVCLTCTLIYTGQIIFNYMDGNNRKTYSFTTQESVADGLWHKIELHKTKNLIVFKIDDEISQQVHWNIDFNFKESTILFGGSDDSSFYIYMGCLKNIYLNETKLTNFTFINNNAQDIISKSCDVKPFPSTMFRGTRLSFNGRGNAILPKGSFVVGINAKISFTVKIKDTNNRQVILMLETDPRLNKFMIYSDTDGTVSCQIMINKSKILKLRGGGGYPAKARVEYVEIIKTGNVIKLYIDAEMKDEGLLGNAIDSIPNGRVFVGGAGGQIADTDPRENYQGCITDLKLNGILQSQFTVTQGVSEC